MAVLAVAAVSARLLAESAALDGYPVIALDLYGDADTRRAALQWLPLGPVGASRPDPDRLLDALHGLSRRAGGDAVVGWIAGSGFEAQAELLAAGAKVLPLIGTAAADVRRIRDPGEFFAALSALGIAHPATQWRPPADRDGWLSKDANACGGWHILPAALAAGAASSLTSRYFQRALPGSPMSATFIANGREARLLGFNELIVRPFGSRPFVYCGCIGPVTVPADAARQVGEAVRLLSTEFRLRGWCSLDFMRDGDEIAVLEVNPRPSASMALYAPRGQTDAQLRACLDAELPPPGALEAPWAAGGRMSGSRIVYARRRLRLGAIAAQRLAAWPNAHDLPVAGASFEPGDPVCSLGAQGVGAERVQALLSAGHDALLDTLDTGDEP